MERVPQYQTVKKVGGPRSHSECGDEEYSKLLAYSSINTYTSKGNMKLPLWRSDKLQNSLFSGLLHCVVWWLDTTISEDSAASQKTKATQSSETTVSKYHTT
jgi:hypothetical protein